MKEMMQKLNVVKYATSEEQKETLVKKGFVPVESASATSNAGQDQETKSQLELDQKNQQKSGQKTKTKMKQKSQQKPEPESGQGIEGTSNPELQMKEVQAGDGNA